MSKNRKRYQNDKAEKLKAPPIDIPSFEGLPGPREVTIKATWTDEEIAEALIKNDGLQYLAAESIGMCKSTISLRINQSDYLKEVRANCRQTRIDKAEKVLFKKTDEESLGGAIYILKTIGKDRGYVENNNTTFDPQVLEQFARLMKMLSNPPSKNEDS